MAADFRKIFNLLQTVPFVEYMKNNTKHREKTFLNSRAGLPTCKWTNVEFSAELEHKHTHITLHVSTVCKLSRTNGGTVRNIRCHVRRRRSIYWSWANKQA